MGLDAYVACNCFEEGKLSEPPEPFTMDDVYRDEEGFLCSHMLDNLRKGLSYSDHWDRYDSLIRSFEQWTERACEHEDGEYFSEWVSNWSDARQFQSIVEELGGRSNGGCFPAELAAEAIAEIDDLTECAKSLVVNVLVCEDSEEPVWTCADGATSLKMMGPYFEMGMEGGCQEMAIILHETGEVVYAFDYVGPDDAPKVAREFWVEPREAPFMHEGNYYTAERIRSLLVASVETGNPIRWC